MSYERLPYHLVMIEWVDSSRLNNGWIDLREIPDPYLSKCVTVGFVVYENEYGKILVPTVADVDHAANSQTYGGMIIPLVAIISERHLTF